MKAHNNRGYTIAGGLIGLTIICLGLGYFYQLASDVVMILNTTTCRAEAEQIASRISSDYTRGVIPTAGEGTFSNQIRYRITLVEDSYPSMYAKRLRCEIGWEYSNPLPPLGTQPTYYVHAISMKLAANP